MEKRHKNRRRQQEDITWKGTNYQQKEDSPIKRSKGKKTERNSTVQTLKGHGTWNKNNGF
jgi:hypothetical protein